MIIEIKGAGSLNKGAEMMLLTILEQFRDEDVKFTIVPQKGVSDYSFYSKLGIYPKVWLRYKGIQFGKFGKFIPKKIRELYGLIIDEDIDVILDASGFRYTSQWGEPPTKLMAREAKLWKKDGKKIILLPQAFGPFITENIKNDMKTIVKSSNLIYARDRFSYQELLKITDDINNIKLYPDFTVLFKGRIPSYFNHKVKQVCIVPNQRMKDKVNNAKNYEKLFSKIIYKLQDNGFSPFFLIHGGNEDLEIAKKINNLLNYQIEIISEENPYFIKGIIENSIGLIGSRFHSLASGLYSGIPSLGTGWSHKYLYLFEEFDYKEGLFELTINDDELDDKLEMIMCEDKRKKIKSKLLDKKSKIEFKSLQMFKDIKKEIGLV